jgi:hypothetical protein
MKKTAARRKTIEAALMTYPATRGSSPHLIRVPWMTKCRGK